MSLIEGVQCGNWKKISCLIRRDPSLRSGHAAGAFAPAACLSMTSEQFAVHIGLTPNQYCKRAQAARLIRFHPDAQKLLESGETQVSHSGHMPSLGEIFVKATEDLLDKRDPLRKAERAKARFENSPAPSPAKTAMAEAEPEVEVVSEPASPGKRDQGPVKKPATRPAIPAQVS